MSEVTSTFDLVKRTTVLHLGSDESEVTLSAKFADDLHADSLDLIELSMAFEEELDISISDDEMAAIVTVSDAVTLIDRLLAEKTRALEALNNGDRA